MNIELPELILYGTAIVLIVVWLCALQFMIRSTYPRTTMTPEERELLDLGAVPSASVLAGTTEVTGEPAELSSRAAATLAKQTVLGPVKILEQTDQKLRFEGLAAGTHGPGQLFTTGELRFAPAANGRTRIDYAVETPPRRGLLAAGWVFIVLGLVAIVTGFVLLQLLAVNSPDPAMRWQSLQMIQAGHFIWPPFLFGGFHRRLRSHLRSILETLVHNLPYTTA